MRKEKRISILSLMRQKRHLAKVPPHPIIQTPPTKIKCKQAFKDLKESVAIGNLDRALSSLEHLSYLLYCKKNGAVTLTKMLGENLMQTLLQFICQCKQAGQEL